MKWVTFHAPDGRELCAYTVQGSFSGEMQATKDLLAYEHGLKPEQISVSIETKNIKGK